MTTNGNIRERFDAGPEAVGAVDDVVVVVPTVVPEPVESPTSSDFELPGRYLAVKYAASRLLAAILLVLSLPLLLVIAVWCFSRSYYFAFYVIQHYVDPGYKFAGLWDFFQYTMGRRQRPAAEEADTVGPSVRES